MSINEYMFCTRGILAENEQPLVDSKVRVVGVVVRKTSLKRLVANEVDIQPKLLLTLFYSMFVYEA